MATYDGVVIGAGHIGLTAAADLTRAGLKIAVVERLNTDMIQGAVRIGAYVPNQLGITRPHPLMPGARTPVEGRYLCGSSSGNGGGVNGAPGYIAANAIADDLRLDRPWMPLPPPERKY
jgi:phytoene dehydrogenase-like protein